MAYWDTGTEPNFSIITITCFLLWTVKMSAVKRSNHIKSNPHYALNLWHWFRNIFRCHTLPSNSLISHLLLLFSILYGMTLVEARGINGFIVCTHLPYIHQDSCSISSRAFGESGSQHLQMGSEIQSLRDLWVSRYITKMHTLQAHTSVYAQNGAQYTYAHRTQAATLIYSMQNIHMISLQSS